MVLLLAASLSAVPWGVICGIAAIILFILAALNVPSSKINLTAAGLVFLTLAILLG